MPKIRGGGGGDTMREEDEEEDEGKRTKIKITSDDKREGGKVLEKKCIGQG